MSVRKIGGFRFNISKKLFASQKKTLPIALGNIAKNFFKNTFIKGGFTDISLKRWISRRKRLGKGRTSDTLREASNLTKTGTLRRSIKVARATFRRTRIFTNLVYAAIHNFGLDGLAFGKHHFKMPEREFMGDSRELERKLEQRIVREIDKVFK